MAKVFDNPFIEALVYKLRDPKSDNKTFRKALEKLGEYMAVEVSKELGTQEITIKTLLGEDAKHVMLA